MPGQLERRSKPLTACSRSSRVFPPGRIINLGIRTAFQPFPTSESLPCCSDSGRFNYSSLGPSIPVSLLSFTLFAGRGGNREGSLLRCSFSRFVLPLLLFSRSPLRLPKINRQKLAVFLHFFLSLLLLFHWFLPSYSLDSSALPST